MAPSTPEHSVVAGSCCQYQDVFSEFIKSDIATMFSNSWTKSVARCVFKGLNKSWVMYVIRD